MPIIGTAGHVDHGKSTLVEALTGRDPDRWADEKARGLTIDLGFAWSELGDGDLSVPGGGESVGFVDVPGHERFIKNMLAGVGGVDVALFVVAADEGWMPQSEEHLSVLDLLGVRHGVVALTRIDLVESELAELASLEIEERLEGTSLEGWPIVPVSAISGEGLDAIRSALAAAVAAAGEPHDVGRPRLWVDRSFTISGAGAVVTGTLVNGTIERGDELALWPGPRKVRVRALQSHEREADAIGPGNRAAVNVSGVDRVDIDRGAMLAAPGHFRATDRLLADLRPVRNLNTPLSDRGAYHLHVGSGAWSARIRLLEGDELSDHGAALIQIESPIPVTVGDPFILRDVGRRAVAAGGIVLDPSPRPRSAAARASLPILRLVANAPPDKRASALLTVRGRASMNEIAADTGGGTPSGGVSVDDEVLSEAGVTSALEELDRLVAAFHAANPMRPGIPKASLSSGSGLSQALVGVVIEASGGALIDDGPTVRRAAFTSSWDASAATAWHKARTTLKESGYAVPRASQLGLDQEVVHALIRNGDLVRIEEDLVYLPDQIDAIIDELPKLGDGFTVAAFRDALGITRRHAVPIVEWLDASGWTQRSGDVRFVKRRSERRPGDVPSP